MEEREVFGTRLRRRRQMLGLNQQQLADQLGMRVASISRYEQGVYKEMSFARLRQIALALQTTADFLLGLSNEAGPIPELCPAEGLCLTGFTPLPATYPYEGSDSLSIAYHPTPSARRPSVSRPCLRRSPM